MVNPPDPVIRNKKRDDDLMIMSSQSGGFDNLLALFQYFLTALLKHDGIAADILADIHFDTDRPGAPGYDYGGSSSSGNRPNRPNLGSDFGGSSLDWGKLDPKDAQNALNAAIGLIKKREGFKLTVYPDNGKLAVGYGHQIRPEDGLKEGDTITIEQAEAFFRKDVLTSFNSAIVQAEEANINEPFFVVALASVNFQLGTGWTEDFHTTWPAIKNGDYVTALKNLEASKWNSQTPLRVNDFQEAIILLAAKRGEPISDNLQTAVLGKVLVPEERVERLIASGQEVDIKSLLRDNAAEVTGSGSDNAPEVKQPPPSDTLEQQNMGR